jgi:hypothetical protein
MAFKGVIEKMGRNFEAIWNVSLNILLSAKGLTRDNLRISKGKTLN